MYMSGFFFQGINMYYLEGNLQLSTMDHKIHIFCVHIFFALTKDALCSYSTWGQFNVDPQTSRGSSRQICGYEQATSP